MRTCSPLTVHDLSEIARRATYIRCKVIESIAEAGSGHPGGSLSCADILALLFFRVLSLDPERPDWEDRDRFILAKGHAAPALYAALAARGFFPEAELNDLRRLGSMLQGHPDMRRTPGVEASTGSLGQGLSLAVGAALAGKLDGKDYGVYALLGDGELQEGQVWEAAAAASHYGLDNLIAFVDHNGLQIDGRVSDIMSCHPMPDRWRAFGWHVWEVDGHDLEQLSEAVARAQGADGPAVLIARTVKGKGVSFMEDQVSWHGKAPSREQARRALLELRGGSEDE
ncbi:MAG: transketolase [Bacillota bacterium]